MGPHGARIAAATTPIVRAYDLVSRRLLLSSRNAGQVLAHEALSPVTIAVKWPGHDEEPLRNLISAKSADLDAEVIRRSLEFTFLADTFRPMSSTSIFLAEEALALPAAQRAELANLLMDSLAGDARSDEEIKLMLQSRLADLKSGRDSGLGFEDIFAELPSQESRRTGKIGRGTLMALSERQIAG